MRRPLRALAALTYAGLALALSSCSSGGGEKLPETGATLEGTITYNNEPVQFAMVSVSGEGGKVALGKVQPDGKYKVENVPLGAVTIGVNTAAAEGDFRSASMSAGAYKGPEVKGKAKTGTKFVTVPPKYFDPATSGVKTDIKVGTNTYDIVLDK